MIQAVETINPTDKSVELETPPHNIEAEQALLGSILMNNEVLNRVSDFLRAEHFFEPLHQRMYEAIERFIERGLVATAVTLKNQFEQDEAMQEMGGVAYLSRISSLASGVMDARSHASVVYSLAIARQLVDIGEEMVFSAKKSTGELRASEQIEQAEHKLFTLASEGNSDTNFAPLKFALIESIDTAEKASKRKGAISGIPMGFSDMDKLFGGMHNSDLMILAARPSMGKTALALNIALQAAEHLKHTHDEELKKNPTSDHVMGSVGFISLEMSSEQLATRLLSIKTGINAGDIRRGRLDASPNNDEFAKLIQANQLLHDLPIYIDDTPALSTAALRTRARRLKRKHNLSFLVIDYLQLLRGVSEQSKTNRVQEISEISMGLKAIAKELNIPVMALSQLSRAVEQRPDKRPQLADLRESGSIEQDADQVMFIYREAYYIERKKPPEGTETFHQWMEEMERVNNLAEIMMAKNRNGPVDNVTLFFDKTTTRFADYAAIDRYDD